MHDDRLIVVLIAGHGKLDIGLPANFRGMHLLRKRGFLLRGNGARYVDDACECQDDAKHACAPSRRDVCTAPKTDASPAEMHTAGDHGLKR